ncbi:MAG: FAD-dependent oxidoreductase [Acidimicrobiia bacterium]
MLGALTLARLELARDAGLTIDGGVATDPSLHTSADGVYAAGDIAAAWHPHFNARLRVEH